MKYKYICCHCGKGTDNIHSNGCVYSPTKYHEWISAEGKTQFVCAYCGTKTHYPFGGGCSSPTKCHKWM